MKKILASLVLGMGLSAGSAYGFNCQGPVIAVTTDHPQCPTDRSLFVISVPGASGDTMLCTASKSSDALVLTALVSGRTVRADVPNVGNCTGITPNPGSTHFPAPNTLTILK